MKYLVSAAFGIGILALPVAASAAIVCNAEGDCWRVKDKYEYPAEAGLQVYADDWTIDTEKYRWRDVGGGRGYWRGGVWVTF